MARTFALITFFVFGFNTYAQYFTKDSLVDASSNNVPCRGSAWGDFDNDGDDDLFLAVDDISRLFRNDGNGSFSEVFNSGVEAVEKAVGAVWGDYDNDTLIDLDVFSTGRNYLFHNDGNGKFTLTSEATGSGSGGTLYCLSATWVDVNNDGYIDLYICTYSTTENLFYINNGNGTFTRKGVGESDAVLAIGKGRMRASFSDFNNDGFADLHINGFISLPDPNDTTNYLFINDSGNFIQADITKTPFMPRVVASTWGDYNHDGYQDLLFVASDPWPTVAAGKLCTNTGTLPFQTLSPNIGDSIIYSDNPIMSDFDNDGYLDILAVNVSGGKVYFFRNSATYNFSRVMNDPLSTDNTGAKNIAANDFDNDGDMDVFISSGTKNYLYRNNGNNHHWIKIRLYGVVSNYCAIGAKIKVKAVLTNGGEAVWQMREVIPNAIPSQNSLEQIFGLGDATIVDSIKIYWPSGNIQELANVSVDQYRKIRETVVDFNYTTDCGTLNTHFYNTSPIQGPYFWDFGDGTKDTTSDTTSFQHLYPFSGHFLVVLTDPTGKSVRKDSVFIDNSIVEVIQLTGPLVIPNKTQNIEYSIPYKQGSKYKWFVTGGTQVSGDSSNRILVDWGVPGKGFVKVEETLINQCPGRFAQDSVTLLEDQFQQAVSVFPAETLRTSSATWVDTDNDGYIDLYVTNDNGPAALYKYNGSFFTPVTATAIVQEVSSVTGCAWGDYNNDGLTDVFITRDLGQNNLLFRNDGGNVFSKIITGNLVNDGGDSYSATWGDYNRDGLIDLFVANLNGKSFLYRNKGEGSFMKITDVAPVLNAMQAVDASWIDYDNNNTLDLFITRGNEKNLFYKNTIDSTFILADPSPVGDDISYSQGSSWADFDNDGDMDLFIPNNYDNDNFLYENTGDGNFIKITSGEIVNDGGYSTGSSWADFDNDGDEDLMVTNEGSNNFMYKNNGDKTFLKLTGEITVNDQSNSLASAWFDYDNSGTLDLYVANNNQDLFYRATDFGVSWLGIKCKGVISNASALGTKIYVKANTGVQEVWQMRVISDHTGHGSQNGLLQHFGLGTAGFCDSIKIVWPSGRIQYLTQVSVNRIITVTESNLPVIHGKKVCAGSFVSLNAEGELIKWYESDTALTPFFTGNIYNTPLLNDSVTYYATNTVSGVESERLPVIIAVLQKPGANFTVSDTLLVLPTIGIQFTDQSTGAYNWQWNFGDGDTSSKQNPMHTYSQQGYYSVKLKVGNPLCPPDSIVKNNLIHITSSVFEDGVDKNSLIIRPMPEQKNILIEWRIPGQEEKEKSVNIEFNIIGLTGQRIQSGKIQNKNFIYINNLPEGLYILNLKLIFGEGRILITNRKLIWH